jgi:hypothetical protein
MLPNTTNRYGDLLREFYSGIKADALSETRLAEIQRTFNELGERENRYRSILAPAQDVYRFSEISARVAKFDILPSRMVDYKFSGNVSIPNSTYTYVEFPTTRGYLDSPENYACMRRHATDTKAFTRNNSIVTTKNLIVMFGKIQFAPNAVNFRYIGIEFFNSNGTSSGTYEYSYESTADYVIGDFIVADYMGNGQYVKLYVWQNSGGALDIQFGDFVFFLA